MTIRCIWEHNGADSLLYCADYPGAYTRGESREIASKKMTKELCAFSRWSGLPIPDQAEFIIVQEKASVLQIADADSDIIFDEETLPFCEETYQNLKSLALKSASDFHQLYLSIPDKNTSVLPVRTTFYGNRPRTAQEMYVHTKNVNSYYFAEIGIDTDNDGTIFDCRRRGFEKLEENSSFLNNTVIEGSYGEFWSVRKLLRRFIWHDRIHAKAMYRMASKTFPSDTFLNPFEFDL